MSDRETYIRSVFFLVIGILLVLSLIVCIFIINNQKDLVNVDAVVTKVTKDADGSGKNDVKSIYMVNGTPHEYEFSTTDDLNVDDTVSIYYHKDSPTSVTPYKVPKLIFLCPVLGLVLCVVGLYELFKRKKNSTDGEEEFKTSVIGVVGDTQQLKIVAAETNAQEYEKTPEEEIEPTVKTIKKEPEKVELVKVVEPVKEEPAIELPMVASVPEVEEEVVVTEPEVEEPITEAPTEPVPKPVMVEAVKQEEKVVPRSPVVVAPKPTVEVQESAPKPASSQMTEAIVKKVQSNIGNHDSKVAIDEDDIKQVIKDVLKEVINEVKEEKIAPKPVVQKRVLPNYYYISGTSLIYEEPGKESQEISLKKIKKVVRTVNSEGNVVKLIVSNEEVKCILTNMKNIDLEQVASLLNNKMRAMDENFREEIEYKEY